MQCYRWKVTHWDLGEDKAPCYISCDMHFARNLKECKEQIFSVYVHINPGDKFTLTIIGR